IHKIFNMEKGEGLSKYLKGECGYREVLKPTGYENLFIISAGQRPDNPTELLGSERMTKLIDEVRRDFDIVIFDSPAVLPVSDALLLAPHVAAVMVVFRMFKTPLKSASFLLSSLKKIRANVIGAVLNGIPSRDGYYMYYGYYRYYHYYHQYYYDYDYSDKSKSTALMSLEEKVREFFNSVAREDFGRFKDKIHSFYGKKWFFAVIFLIMLAASFFIFTPEDVASQRPDGNERLKQNVMRDSTGNHRLSQGDSLFIKQNIRKIVEGWAFAWSNSPVKQFASFYSEDFRNRISRKMVAKSDLDSKYPDKKMSVDRFEYIYLSNDSVAVRFNQRIIIDDRIKQVGKILEFVKRDGNYLITGEKIIKI
ncbi:MAG: tyrosine-protein kinase family protein, partial [Fibrobacterota bacterium]